MSTWIEAEQQDVELSEDKKTIQVYVMNDDFGSVYIEIPVEYIIDIIKGCINE